MALDRNAAVVKELQTLFNVGAVRELTDGQLLERFATDRGEAAELAFAVLVERHGPMVLRVCRSVLADSHDTEDAFQAAFLVLVQKARGLWVRDSHGPWLHQVAFRTASRARVAAARRRRHEARGAAAREQTHTMNSDDLGGLLHEEIERLPERYRVPVVLCDLEGRSHEQAARHLGWPLGTVKSRQARGRERLRDRLRRRGLAPNVGLLGSGPVLSGPAPVVSPALVDGTIRSVVQFVTCQTAIKASTLSLAKGVLKAMSLTRWSKVASVLLVVGATVSGAGIFAQRQGPAAQIHAGNKVETARADELITFRARPGNLAVTIIGPGSIEALSSTDVFSAIEGTTTIMSIVPEGTAAKKGEVICQLDSASLRDQLFKTQIAAQSDEVAYQNAITEREVAELALSTFSEVTFNQELNIVRGEVAAAQSAIQKAENRLERTRRARQRLSEVLASKKNVVTPSDVMAELDIEDRVDAGEETLSRETAALGLAKTKQEILEKFTKGMTIKKLASDVERKRRHELAKQATWQLDKGKMRALERQIAACTIKAPQDGLVVHANGPRPGVSRPRPQIEEGAMVRERQKILSLLDRNGPKQVDTKVEESQIARIKNGMQAKIRVHAFPDQAFSGKVVVVNPLPDTRSTNQGDSNVFTAKVKIENGVPGLRPGMTTQVEFLVAQEIGVLSVPISAVTRYQGKDRVAVRTPSGGTEWREVTVGLSNDKFVEITQGIASGDTVVVNPAALVSDQEKHEKPDAPPKANPPR